MILTVSIHPTAYKAVRHGQGGRDSSVEMSDPGGSATVTIFLPTVEDHDALLKAVADSRASKVAADTDRAIAADVDAQIRRDGDALGRRIAADEGIEPKADPVPWPIGFCGHPVPPGAWAAGFHYCRDCITSGHDTFDRAARQLGVVDDEDGPQ